MQAVWRGYKARKRFNKMKAGYRILLALRAYKARPPPLCILRYYLLLVLALLLLLTCPQFKKYFFLVKKAFEGVENDPKFGKDVEWPVPPPVLKVPPPSVPRVVAVFAYRFMQDARILLGKIHACWRAKKMITRLTPQEQAYVRQKVVALDIFRGKKPYQYARPPSFPVPAVGSVWLTAPEQAHAQVRSGLPRQRPQPPQGQVHRRLPGTASLPLFYMIYLLVPVPPVFLVALSVLQALFSTYGDTQVLFADEVTKVNRGGSADRRVIVVTEQNIYKLDPKSYKVHRLSIF
jgi:myosin-1